MREFKIDLGRMFDSETPVLVASDSTWSDILDGPATFPRRITPSKFYDDNMLDYLLKDVINEKAKEAMKELDYHIKQQAKKKVRTFNNRIKRVIFSDPVTVILWANGDKTTVRCQPGETYDKEKGLALAIIKHEIGENQSCFNDIFKKWIEE